MGWKTSKSKGAAKIRTLMKRDGELCWLCGEPFSNQSGRKPSLDHVIPRCFGGANANTNLKLAHSRCNSLRGNNMKIVSTNKSDNANDNSHNGA